MHLIYGNDFESFFKVTRVMLLWVNNHYYDFAGDRYMESCLERFELLLDAKV